MAHFARIRAPGAWVNGTAVDQTEFEAFDANLYKAANFDDGGSWSPAAIISLAGAGLACYGSPLKLYDAAGPTLMVEWDPTNGGEAGLPALYLRQAVRVDFLNTSRLLLGATTTTAWSAGATKTDGSTTTATGDWTVSGGAWTFANTAGTTTFDNQVVHGGACTVHGTFTTTGDTQLGDAAGDALAVNATTTHTAPTTFSAAINVNAASTLTKAITCSSDGTIIPRVATAVDADHTYAVADCDLIFVDNTTLTGNHTYTLSAAGAVNGSRIRFVTEEITWTITISTPALGATVFVATAGNPFAADYLYYGGAWHLASRSKL